MRGRGRAFPSARRVDNSPAGQFAHLGDGHRGAEPRAGARPEGEMAVIALVERFEQVKAGGAERGVDLAVAHPGAAGDVDRAAVEVVAVGDSPDRAIMRRRAEDAGDPAEPRAEQ